MNIVGIISEYNPFHLGHKHHIDATKALLGEDTRVISVMTGNFVQRGEPASFSKNARAEAAIKGGADLVIELPLPWALSSAEGFARGAVGILAGCGIVSHLSFGSESGNIDELENVAKLLMEPELDVLIKEELLSGISYALARQRALERHTGRALPEITSPNNILGIEYIKALYDQRLNIKPVTIPRKGSAHDSLDGGNMPSAAELRLKLNERKSIHGFVTAETEEILRREVEQGRGPVFVRDLESAILSRLRMLPESAYNEIPDAAEGLGRRLHKAASAESSLDAIIAQAKSKRYALSRLRRMTMCAALGIARDDNVGTPPYIRVLASNTKGLELLRMMTEKAKLPVISKSADIRKLDREAIRLFELESAATDLYCLGFSAVEERRGGRDWRISPIIVR